MIALVILLDGIVMSKPTGIKQQYVLVIVETVSRFKMKRVMMGTIKTVTDVRQTVLF